MSLSQLHQAVLFAADRHRGDDTDLNIPYLCHVLDVVNNLALSGETDPTVLTAAALHDVVEHGGVSLEEVKTGFGEQVAGLVRELTRTEPDPSTTSSLSNSEIRTLRSKLLLQDVAKMSVRAKRVKLADRLSNLRVALRAREGKRLDRYLEQTRAMLNLVPPDVDRALWNEIDSILTARSR